MASIVTYPEDELRDIPMSEIFDDEDFNCRGAINALSVAELAKDIKQNGLTQPITIQPWDKKEGKKYRLIAGYRRFKAHQINAAQTVKAIIKYGVDDERAVAMNLSENVQREDLTILQEARAIEKLKLHGWSASDVSREIGKSYGWCQVRFMYLELPPDIQEEIVRADLPHSVIRDIWTQDPGQPRYDLLKRIKDAKILGKKRPINPNKVKANKPNSKRVREKAEIEMLQDTIREAVGNNLATKVLGWVLGLIDDLEVHQKIREDALAGTYGKKSFYPIPVGLTVSQSAFTKATLRK
jgi:ParB family chromosome partitioning protein